MRKLKLDIENVTVESFTAEPPAERRGTVHAHGTRFDPSCYFSCEIGCTYDLTCYNPCD